MQNFYEKLQYSLKNIKDLTSFFKTRKNLIEGKRKK